MGAVILVNVPELNEYLRPRLGVGPAVEGCKLTDLNFRDVIAASDPLVIIGEDEGSFLCVIESGKEFTKADVGIGSRKGLVVSVYLRYSRFNSSRIIEIWINVKL